MPEGVPGKTGWPRTRLPRGFLYLDSLCVLPCLPFSQGPCHAELGGRMGGLEP